MESLLLLVPLSMGLAAFFLWMFFQAVSSGQFDDFETPAQKMIIDHFDETRSKNENDS